MPNDHQAPPVPDPTVLSTDAIARAVKAERDYETAQLDVLRERLRGIDKATELLNETVNRVPTDVQREVSHLRELSNEKFNSIAIQFAERDTRSERESRDNKVAVDAAFAAQKEAAARQDEANQKAIDKSEKSTAETIAKLSELFKTSGDGFMGQIADIKERITRAEGAATAAASAASTALAVRSEGLTERRGSQGNMIAIVSIVGGSLIGIAGLLIAVLK
jgi:hypothetical protein